MTQDEYDQQQAILKGRADVARRILNDARSRYEKISDEMRDLRITWQEQQAAAVVPPAEDGKQ